MKWVTGSNAGPGWNSDTRRHNDPRWRERDGDRRRMPSDRTAGERGRRVGRGNGRSCSAKKEGKSADLPNKEALKMLGGAGISVELPRLTREEEGYKYNKRYILDTRRCYEQRTLSLYPIHMDDMQSPTVSYYLAECCSYSWTMEMGSDTQPFSGTLKLEFHTVEETTRAAETLRTIKENIQLTLGEMDDSLDADSGEETDGSADDIVIPAAFSPYSDSGVLGSSADEQTSGDKPNRVADDALNHEVTETLQAWSARPGQHPGQVSTCLCGQIFPSISKFRSHAQNCVKAGKCPVPTCTFMFTTDQRAVSSHVLERHKLGENRTGHLVCPIHSCLEVFQRVDRLQVHLLWLHGASNEDIGRWLTIVGKHTPTDLATVISCASLHGESESVAGVTLSSDREASWYQPGPTTSTGPGLELLNKADTILPDKRPPDEPEQRSVSPLPPSVQAIHTLLKLGALLRRSTTSQDQPATDENLHHADSLPVGHSPSQITFNDNTDGLRNWGQPVQNHPTMLGFGEAKRDENEDWEHDFNLGKALGEGGASVHLGESSMSVAAADDNDDRFSNTFNGTSQEDHSEIFGFSPDVDRRPSDLQEAADEEDNIFGTYPDAQHCDIWQRDKDIHGFPSDHQPSGRATSDFEDRQCWTHPDQTDWDREVPYRRASFPVQKKGYQICSRRKSRERVPMLQDSKPLMDKKPLLPEPDALLPEPDALLPEPKAVLTEPVERSPTLQGPGRGFHNAGPYLDHNAGLYPDHNLGPYPDHRHWPPMNVDCNQTSFNHSRDSRHSDRVIPRFRDGRGPFF